MKNVLKALLKKQQETAREMNRLLEVQRDNYLDCPPENSVNAWKAFTATEASANWNQGVVSGIERAMEELDAFLPRLETYAIMHTLNWSKEDLALLKAELETLTNIYATPSREIDVVPCPAGGGLVTVIVSNAYIRDVHDFFQDFCELMKDMDIDELHFRVEVRAGILGTWEEEYKSPF